ncbi:hypothetical protein C7974DRAFT_473564 [Boeremia exigua]|uniref:uncharacterized protein n=1 Tax=Boeremia exigua TaxID=749465 RepID=UPI001E8CFB3E|nr:uncharacterized protein C7974DRAFT_473564 [Boeremia exigua]KAH6622216.1 hypothetical protein C7974DRAFT_473564 [Boeremia exigua]
MESSNQHLTFIEALFMMLLPARCHWLVSLFGDFAEQFWAVLLMLIILIKIHTFYQKMISQLNQRVAVLDIEASPPSSNQLCPTKLQEYTTIMNAEFGTFQAELSNTVKKHSDMMTDLEEQIQSIHSLFRGQLQVPLRRAIATVVNSVALKTIRKATQEAVTNLALGTADWNQDLLFELQDRTKAHGQQVDQLRAQSEKAEQRRTHHLNQLESTIIEQAKAIAALNDTIRTLLAANTTTQTQLTELQSSIKDLQKRSDVLEERTEDLGERTKALDEVTDGLYTSVQELQNMASESEGEVMSEVGAYDAAGPASPPPASSSEGLQAPSSAPPKVDISVPTQVFDASQHLGMVFDFTSRSLEPPCSLVPSRSPPSEGRRSSRPASSQPAPPSPTLDLLHGPTVTESPSREETMEDAFLNPENPPEMDENFDEALLAGDERPEEEWEMGSDVDAEGETDDEYVAEWDIPQKGQLSVEDCEDDQPLAELDKERSEWDELAALYHVSDAEWNASQTQWREWVSKRDTVGALDAGRFHIPPEKAVWQEGRILGEERFSKALSPQHEGCLSCSMKRDVESDETLSGEKKAEQLAQLAHDVPILRVPANAGGPVLPQTFDELSFEQLVDISAWNHDRAKPSQTMAASQIASLMEEAINAADSLQHLSTAEKKAYCVAAAEAWKLQLDLVRLEHVRQSIESRIEIAKTGYSVSTYNIKKCRDRMKNMAELEGRYVRYGGLSVFRRSYAGDERKDIEHEEDKEDDVITAEVPHTEVKEIEQKDSGSESVHSTHDMAKPRGRSENEQTAQSTAARDLFFNTMRTFNQLNRKTVQENDARASTEDGPCEPWVGREKASTGMVKKDSKVESLMEEDGVSLQDFAARPEEKGTAGLRKLSTENGSSSRPRWRS